MGSAICCTPPNSKADMVYKGVRYKLEDPQRNGAYATLYTWNDLVQQWIFECSLSGNDTAEYRIDCLLELGIVRNNS